MSNGIIYLIQPTELIGTKRYKIGCSKNTELERVKKGYKKGTRYIVIMECKEPFVLEKKIKTNFYNHFKLIAGCEYFEGNEEIMKEEFLKLIKEHNKIYINNDNFLIDENNYKTEKFKTHGFVKKKDKINNYTIATIYNFAHEDNKTKFLENLNHNTFELEKYDMCLYIKLLAENRFFYIKNGDLFKLYCFNGKYWVNDDTLLKKFISTELYEFLKLMVEELYFKNSNFTKMRNQINKLKMAKFKHEMVMIYKEINLKNDIKFDNKWNLLGFENIVYDLEKGDFRNYEYEDYISITTGYDWREPTKEEINLINKLICQIMPDEEERDLYLQILSTALDGKNVENFIIFNGSGGNGKGMINDLLLTAIGNYGFIGNNSILFASNKTGSNPEKSNLYKKRLVIFREPPENKKFENSIIKELNLLMIVEANKKPLMAEEPDVRRIIDMYFKTKYTTDKNLVDEKNGIYLANKYYKTEEFKNKYKFALLKILMDEYKKYQKNNYIFIIPKSISERTTLYLEMSCNILQWFKDNYLFTENKNDICKIKDLYNDFVSSIYFINLTKNEKRKYNKTYFNNYISSNPFFGKYYKLSHNHITNCIVGWTKKIDDDL